MNEQNPKGLKNIAGGKARVFARDAAGERIHESLDAEGVAESAVIGCRNVNWVTARAAICEMVSSALTGREGDWMDAHRRRRAQKRSHCRRLYSANSSGLVDVPRD